MRLRHGHFSTDRLEGIFFFVLNHGPADLIYTSLLHCVSKTRDFGAAIALALALALALSPCPYPGPGPGPGLGLGTGLAATRNIVPWCAPRYHRKTGRAW